MESQIAWTDGTIAVMEGWKWVMDAKNKTINQILAEVKGYNEEALAEDKMLKDLEATYIDEDALKNGTLDPQIAAQLYEKKRLATEMRRQLIREKIAMSSSDKVQFIHPKPVPSINDLSHKRVAVYARVSTKSLDQTSSIENQTRYYKDKIAKNPNWELVKIYKDEGKSGTSKKGRKEFQQMLDDAYNQKFDLILCASVSRFARNVGDFVEEITNLRVKNSTHPVGVYFETENIYTLDERSADTLDMQAMFADWESRNKSRRMILSYDQRIFTSQFPVSDLLGYRHTRTGKLIMIPEEAKTVRVIFLAYFCGYSAKEIAEILTEKGRHTLKGRTEWNAAMVKNVMQNERRWGALQARKNVVLDYKKKKIVKNEGIREGAFVAEHHVGIVSPEIAKAVSYLFPNSTRLNGVQDLKVIREGNLKGFISVNPAWLAVDNTTFLDLCCSAYDEEELSRIQQESKIMSGEAHSKVISMEFAGYQVPYGIYFLNRNMPSITLSKNKIKMNKACFTKLNRCKYAELLYHPIYQTIVIRSCDEPTDTSFCWETDEGKLTLSFYAKAFTKALYERMNWIEDLSFQFRGIYRERGNTHILFFSLDEPRIHVAKQKAPTADEPDLAENVDALDAEEAGAETVLSPEIVAEESEEPEEELIQYIKYKNDEGEDVAELPEIAYPDEWQRNIGLSHAMRRRRDWLTEQITEADILVEGTCAVNPLIGDIPSKEQAMEELESLLIEM